jgi:hypothetical protein
LAEVNELFDGWSEEPPVHLLVRALVWGLGGKPQPQVESDANSSTVDEIRAKAGGMLPFYRGRDPGLPKQSAVLDFSELQKQHAMKRLEYAASKTLSKHPMKRENG